MAALTNLTTLLSHVFSSHFVFPVIGHDDPEPVEHSAQPYKNFSELWKLWLPSEALVTFSKGGYYTIEQKRTRLRLVVLNTDYTLANVERPKEEEMNQWEWLEGILKNSSSKNETVYLVGHMAPGMDERAGASSKFPMAAKHNSKYLSLVKKFSDIITGQFFGHLHSDSFRTIYNDRGTPVSRLFQAPSLTPRRSVFGFNSYNNPGFRLYKIELDTGQVLDYSQYYLDLPKANEAEEAEWTLLYNFTDYYNVQEPSPEDLHVLVENFTVLDGSHPQIDGYVFKKYLQANSLNATGTQTSLSSAHGYYCAITRLDPAEYFNCLAATPAPLAAITVPTPISATAQVHLCCPILIICSILILSTWSR